MGVKLYEDIMLIFKEKENANEREINANVRKK